MSANKKDSISDGGDSNSALAHQLMQNLHKENEDLSKIKELLIQKEKLTREIQCLMDKDATASSNNMNLGSMSRRLDDDINQLQIIKASLLRKKDLERDIVRLRGEDDGRSQKSDSGAPSMILQSSVAAAMPGPVFQSNEVGIEASATSNTIVGGEEYQLENDAPLATKAILEEVDNGNEQDVAMHETGDDDESTLDNRKPSSRDGTSNDAESDSGTAYTPPSSMPKRTKESDKQAKPKLGEVGYEFRKKFDSGWYIGKVVDIRPLAGKNFWLLHSICM